MWVEPIPWRQSKTLGKVQVVLAYVHPYSKDPTIKASVPWGVIATNGLDDDLFPRGGRKRNCVPSVEGVSV